MLRERRPTSIWQRFSAPLGWRSALREPDDDAPDPISEPTQGEPQAILHVDAQDVGDLDVPLVNLDLGHPTILEARRSLGRKMSCRAASQMATTAGCLILRSTEMA